MKSIFEIAKSGLRSSQRSLSVTSNNIINADTPGYSRQRVENVPNGMQKDGHHVGLGVNVQEVTRLRDSINDTLLNKKQQDMGYLQKKGDIYEKLESIMVSDSGKDLDSQVSVIFNNFSEMASDPQDVSVRNNLVSEAQQFSAKMRGTANNIDETSDQVRTLAGKTVDSINSLLSDINELNTSIQQGQSKGQPDHTSLDMRVAKMNELSELVDFESRLTKTGAVQIQIGGHNVVDENQSYQIKSEVDDVNKKYRLRMESGHVIEPKGGRIGGEIEMYEKNIPALKDKLDKIAKTVVEKFNALHSNGYGLDDNVQRNFFDGSGTTAQTIKVNQSIVDNTNNIAASSAAGEAGNGEIAAEIAAMRNEEIIGDNATNQRLNDYTVGVISEPGVKVNSIDSTIAARDSEIQMLKQQQEETAGVNVDEELSKMIKFQNAYQGAAKVMSSAQRMYDTLIGIV
ncbi:flagellar hook-associated protein FlgK [Fodinibius halophilus]|uniref:Flagellar hook-associated protein 1 n=1 Tax=Fodinibius halophilus TaxID=1736908 RepID=A0A6M1TFG9_9BACT|nr:flagellar hook-associated protein FlgK [Fodinibius halophilus]NGP87370.1 flagellar hook-associated protein FlgK [Fodinibius halophilus]